MDIHLNDLSFVQTYNCTDKYNLMLDFLEVCEKTQNYFIEKIYVPAGYLQMSISSDLSFTNSFHTIESNHENGNIIFSRIKSLLANRFKVFPPMQKDDAAHWIEWREITSVLLRLSHDLNLPVLSFKTHDDFLNQQFNVDKFSLDTDAVVNHTKSFILNLSDPSHFEVHKSLLTKIQAEHIKVKSKWNALDEPFRFKDSVKLYLDEIKFTERFTKKESCKDGDKKEKKVSAEEHVSIAKEVGTEIANLSGFTHNAHLSKINNRLVFKALNQSVYLAIDTETVSFELHNRHGGHEGEYNFQGEKIENGKSHILKLT